MEKFSLFLTLVLDGSGWSGSRLGNFSAVDKFPGSTWVENCEACPHCLLVVVQKLVKACWTASKWWDWRTFSLFPLIFSPLAFPRTCKLQLCRQDSVCNSFVNFLHSCVTFLLASSSFFFFHSIYSFLWFKISQNSSIPFQSPPLLEVSLFFPRETLLKHLLKSRKKFSWSRLKNSNSGCYTQENDFKVCCSLISKNI